MMCSNQLEGRQSRMDMDYSEKYSFEVEWFDSVASLLRNFYLYYYPSDNTIEIYDIKNRKIFLRRTSCEGIKAEQLYIGGIVRVFSRSMKITGYADGSTKDKLSNIMQRTFAMVKPDAIDKFGEILKVIAKNNFYIGNIKMAKLMLDEARTFYSNHSEDSQLAFMLNYITSGVIVALELIGENAVENLRDLIRPADCAEAEEKATTSLRARSGKNLSANFLHAADSSEHAKRELKFFFPDAKLNMKTPKNTATFKNCTCCVIKPHAVQSRLIGDIIHDIQSAGFMISAIQQFHIDSIHVEEFLEVYKGVLPEYGAMVMEFQSGPCIAMEITHKDREKDVPTEFRKLCGPMDPDIARQLRPHTLRAKYGKTKVQNAIHCSDLPEDGLLEVEYFFKILAGT